MTSLIVRLVAYALLAMVLSHIAYFEAVTLPHSEQFAELGHTETSHALLLLVSALLLAFSAWKFPDYRALAGVMALGFGILMIRENDQILEMWLPHGVWKWPAGVLFAGLLWIVVTRREAFFDQAKSVSSTLAIGVMFSGLSAMVFSRFFGRTTFWEAVMEERYWRVVKNAAEESVELFGIGLLAAGATEMYLELRNRSRSSRLESG